MSARPVSTPVDDDGFSDIADLLATPEEVRAMFEENCQYYLGMTGDEFIAAWRAGRWPDPDGDASRGIPYEPHVGWLASLLPSIGLPE